MATKEQICVRVLFVLSTWPSKEHPYLVYLYHALMRHFPMAEFFLFRKAVNREFADRLIGDASVSALLARSHYRFKMSRNPLDYVRVISRILCNAKGALNTFRNCRRAGYSTKNTLKQLLYFNQLLGRNYDLVYVNALQSARHIGLRCFFPTTRIVASSRGQDFDWTPIAFDQILQDLDHLHVLGHYLRSKAIARGFSDKRITMIPPAILPREVIRMSGSNNARPDGFTILSASRLLWTKGYIYSLRAFALFRALCPEAKDSRYIIIGDGPDLELIRMESLRLQIAPFVVLTGWLEQNDINSRLLGSDVYLFLSIEEGFNNSVMQAQSLGIPCVVSDAGGLPENVVDGQTGFVIPRYDPLAAAEKIAVLFRNSAMRATMAQSAADRMSSQFSLEQQVGKYVEMLELVVGSKESILA